MRELRLGTMSDVYKYIQETLEGLKVDDFNLLQWFLRNWEHVGEEYTPLYYYNEYYAGNHANFEKGVDIAKIPTPWGNCVKVKTWQYDHALYSYDDQFEEREVIFLFAEED